MHRWSTATIALLLAALCALPAQAQFQDVNSLDRLSQALQLATGNYADAYVQPVSDAFGAGMNSALFRTADSGGGLVPGVDIYVGVSVTGALMASSDRRFTPVDETVTINGQEILLDYSSGSVPSAFGSTETPDETVTLRYERNGQTVTETVPLPPGVVDTPVAPLIIPQVGVGTFFGTDVSLRYIPETRIRSYGTVGVFGLAVRHKVSRYLPASPVSISVQGAYNSIRLNDATLEGDVLDASGWAFNVHASKSVPVLPVTFYGGLQYETFNATYSYQFDPSQFGGPNVDPVTFELDQSSANSFRGLAGVTITLAVVRLNVDYALSANDVVTVGLGVQL
jgi:hypothetical protein